MVESEYAKALYELAVENKATLEIGEELKAFVDSLKDKDFYNVLTAPNIDNSKKKEIISNVFKDFNELFIHFVYVLIDNKRIPFSSDIYDNYIKYNLEANNIVKIEIFSAKKLTADELKKVNGFLTKKYDGKKLEVKNIVDEALIGGIQILCNGESLDISLKHSLDLLRESL